MPTRSGAAFFATSQKCALNSPHIQIMKEIDMPTRSGGTPERVFVALFSDVFLDALYIRNIYANSLRRGFFCNVETTCVKDPRIDVGCGLLGDSLL